MYETYILAALGIFIPILFSLICIGCGLKVYSAAGISLIITVLIIWIIHPFQINQDNAVTPQIGDKFVAWYTIVALSLALIAFFISAIKSRTKACCPCKCCGKDDGEKILQKYEDDFSYDPQKGTISYYDSDEMYYESLQSSGTENDFFI